MIAKTIREEQLNTELTYYVCGNASLPPLLIFNAVGRRGDIWGEFAGLFPEYYIIVLDMDVSGIKDDYIHTLCRCYQQVLKKECLKEPRVLTWCSGTKLYLHMVEEKLCKPYDFAMLSPDFAHFKGKDYRISDFESNMKKLSTLLWCGESQYVYEQYLAGFWGQELYFRDEKHMLSVFGLFDELSRFDYGEITPQKSMECRVFNGENDPITPTANMYVANALFPKAEVKAFSGIGHYFFRENPKLLAAQMRNYWNEADKHRQELESVHAKWNTEIHPTIPQRFLSHVMHKKSETFLVVDDKAYSYEKINALSDALTAYFQDRGVRRGSIVAIRLPKSAELVAAMLAVMKIGAVYMNINMGLSSEYLAGVSFPTEMFVCYLEDIMEWMKPYHALPLSNLPDISEQAEFSDAAPRMSEVEYDDLAMISLTSGSTGVPKQVKNQVFDIVNLMEHLDSLKSHREAESIYMNLSPAFNFGVESILYALYSGKTLHMRNGRYGLSEELSYILKYGISMFYMASELLKIPALSQMLGALHEVKLRSLVVAGSAAVVREDLLSALEKSCILLVNDYGISEYLTLFTGEVSKDAIHEGNVSVGSPIAGVEAILADDAGDQIYSPYERGHLYIAKTCVPDQAFWAERKRLGDCKYYDGKLFFHTGDIAFFDERQAFYIAGRSDNCVKIRGKRVYLEEVENAVSKLDGIECAQAYVASSAEGADALAVMYVSSGKIEEENCMQELRNIVPDYMVPVIWTRKQELFYNCNGKLDRQKNFVGKEEREEASEMNIILSLEPQEIWDKCSHLWGKTLSEIGIDSLGLMIIEAHLQREDIGLEQLSAMKLEDFVSCLLP